MAIGQLESWWSRVIVWDDDGEGLDEEDSLCDIWLDMGVEGGGLGELG